MLVPNDQRYKALLTDYDGTLVGKDLNISPKVANALAKAKNKLRVSIVSGRQFSGKIVELIESLDLHGPHVFCGGAIIYDTGQSKILWKSLIATKDVKKLYEISKKLAINVDVEIPNETFSNEQDYSHRYDQRIIFTPINELPTQNVLKITFRVGESKEKIEQIKKILEQKFSNLRIVPWYFEYFAFGGVDITAASKLEGVFEYLKLVGIKKDEVIAVGDGDNDYPFLQAAGFKVAMGNAVPDLKVIADYVAPPVDQDGVADVIEKFVLK